jgi:methylglutaconyl-CoA hydratase
VNNSDMRDPDVPLAPLVGSSRSGGVLTLSLDDVQRRNVLSEQLVGELMMWLDEAEQDPTVRVVVLTNSGGVFCAGADLSAPADRTSGRSAPQDAELGPRTAPMAALFQRFGHSSKVFVGRIAGHCIAGGMGLAAAMDLCVAVDTAKFGFTEVRVGVAPAMISVLCLPKMRMADARSAFLRGNRLSAEDVARLGLINEAVPAEELNATVAAITADVLRGGPQALAATKQLLAKVPHMSTEAAFEWTQQLSAELFASPEAAAGMGAFLGKTDPPWVPSKGPE